MNNYKILEEKNVIDDHLLDIIGNEFKFDHEKGLSEWIKNSVDAYNRQSIPDNKKHIILRFTDSNELLFECIDFAGMTSIDIDKALKRWGDPEAAKRGKLKRSYGGHGNGGKFYMRQMFEKSYFITYQNGLLNIFGFNTNKKYGFAETFKDKKVNIKEALKIAGIDNLALKNISGFTVVKGLKPSGVPKKINVYKICDKLKKHPQSMRIMDRIKISIIYNGDSLIECLKPDEIKPLKNFSQPIEIIIPEKIIHDNNGEKEEVILANKKYGNGKIILKTSEIALSSNSKYADLNRIDIIGDMGVVASYPLKEFGLFYPQIDFVYGECVCPILEDPDNDCVSNDRSRLIKNSKTETLLNFIKEALLKLCKDISASEKQEKEENNKKISADFNNFLDKWKNRFMNKIIGEVLIGPNDGNGIGSGVGGFSKDLFQNDVDIKNKNKKNQGENEGGGSGEKKTGGHFPKVLLSNYDDDPLNPGNRILLQPTQGLIYQRPQDVNEGIYWINTSSPLANCILDIYGAESIRWRDYLFQRYVEIFIKESLIRLEKKEPDRFNANTIDGEIFGKLVTKIHDVASKELNDFLFNESYDLNNEQKEK